MNNQYIKFIYIDIEKSKLALQESMKIYMTFVMYRMLLSIIQLREDQATHLKVFLIQE